MEAFATNVTSKVENTESADKDKVAVALNNTPLFSSDEIIFPDENNERPSTRYGYQILNLNFLVPEHTASEVIQDQNIFNLPNSPSWIEGLMNIRGNIIPVMNIDKLLKKHNSDKLTNILVLDKSDNSNAIAVMISSLPVSLELNDSETNISNYPDALTEFIKNGFTQNNIDWVEFDPQQLFKKLAGKDVN